MSLTPKTSKNLWRLLDSGTFCSSSPNTTCISVRAYPSKTLLVWISNPKTLSYIIAWIIIKIENQVKIIWNCQTKKLSTWNIFWPTYLATIRSSSTKFSYKLESTIFDNSSNNWNNSEPNQNSNNTFHRETSSKLFKLTSTGWSSDLNMKTILTAFSCKITRGKDNCLPFFWISTALENINLTSTIKLLAQTSPNFSKFLILISSNSSKKQFKPISKITQLLSFWSCWGIWLKAKIPLTSIFTRTREPGWKSLSQHMTFQIKRPSAASDFWKSFQDKDLWIVKKFTFLFFKVLKTIFKLWKVFYE